jgi:hypothetical protein
MEQQSLSIGKAGSAGAKGLTQVMPSTFAGYYSKNIQGFTDFANRTNCNATNLSSDVRCSIEAGARIFNKLLMDYGGDRTKAAIAYNGGPKRVNSSNLPKETYDYAYKKLPACKNPIVKGQSPVANQIWQRLVGRVGEITGGKFALNGVAKLVPYLAGSQPFSSFTNPFNSGQNSIFDSLGSWFKNLTGQGSSGNSSGRPNNSDSVLSNGNTKAGSHSNSDMAKKDAKENFNYSIFSNDLFGSSGENDQTQSNQQNTSLPKASSSFYCFPSTVEKNEPALIVYACDAETEKVELENFTAGANKKYGIVKIEPQKTQEYAITCVSKTRKIRRYCQISVVAPEITEFSVIPNSPKLYDTLTVSWKTKDFRSCELYNSDKSFTRSATEGQAQMKIDRLPDILILKCESINGRITKEEIRI